MITHHTVRANGIKQHYVEAGTGPPVLLLHGFPETWYAWRKQIPVLAERFRVIGDASRIRILDLLREKDMTDVKLVIGGTIPDQDAESLKQQGVAAVFQPGASLDSIVTFIRAHAAN